MSGENELSLEGLAILAETANYGPKNTARLSRKNESRIRAWLAHIGEADQVTIREVLDKCHAEPEALAYYLKRALEVPGPVTTTPYSVRCGDCRHFERIDHPSLGHCAQGEPEAAAGLWDNDIRYCEAYQATTLEAGFNDNGAQRYEHKSTGTESSR